MSRQSLIAFVAALSVLLLLIYTMLSPKQEQLPGPESEAVSSNPPIEIAVPQHENQLSSGEPALTTTREPVLVDSEPQPLATTAKPPVLPAYGLIEPPEGVTTLSYDLSRYQAVLDSARSNGAELAQLHSQFMAEEIEEPWASEQELALYQALVFLSEDDSLQIDAIECRATLCEIVGEVLLDSRLWAERLSQSELQGIDVVANRSVLITGEGEQKSQRFITLLSRDP